MEIVAHMAPSALLLVSQAMQKVHALEAFSRLLRSNLWNFQQKGSNIVQSTRSLATAFSVALYSCGTILLLDEGSFGWKTKS